LRQVQEQYDNHRAGAVGMQAAEERPGRNRSGTTPSHPICEVVFASALSRPHNIESGEHY
jgi:hypothetical protein